MHNYTLIRSNRKTMAIYIQPDATVEVRASLKISKTEIDKFVTSKEKWITEKLLLIQERCQQKAAFALAYGSKILFLGKEYPIIANPGDHIGFDENCFYIPPGLTSPQIKDVCVQAYKLLAKQILIDKTTELASQMDVTPAAVKINSAKTRWGSCSAHKNINYSWRLVMADEDIIDYVVVHELAHITEMNHSVRFWAIVEQILPDYRERRARLKFLQQRLSAENWG